MWSYRGIYFSRHGTLLNTAATLVSKAPAGYFTDELEAVVHVAAKDALRQLARQGRLYRREWEGRYLYCASQRGRRQQQWAARQAQQHPEDDEQAATVLFYSLLDEQQRRLYAGLQSLEWGHGGDQRIAQGWRRYGHASELLILADSGGSNGARCRLWKCAVQEKLVARFQLAATVCHHPTGTSKWNPVEHRLFSEMSKHWAGQPLTDYPTIVRLVGETKTKTGLRVQCALRSKNYPTKIKVSDEQMAALDLLKHPILPEWNYTLLPRINRN